jgi:hypothetical protein
MVSWFVKIKNFLIWNIGEYKTKKKQSTKLLTADCRLPTACEPGGTRTPNLLIRSQMLYPIKLQVR